MKKIRLTQNKFTVVDDDVCEILKNMNWHAAYCVRGKRFYAQTNTRGENGKWINERLNWFVIGRPLKGFVVDHINGDTLDNRRENLRVVTFRENMQNRKSHRSGALLGCGWHKRSKKWRARIVVDGKQRNLGLFSTEKEAHEKYLQVAREFISR